MTERDNHDAVAMLTAYRPDSTSHFDDEWGPVQRADALIDILAAPADPSRVATRLRWKPVAALAACTAAAAVAGGLLLPSGSPGGPDRAAAATLTRLSEIAGQTGGTVAAGHFAYVLESSEQTMSASESDSPPLPGETHVGDLVRSTGEQWTAPDGTVWRTVPIDGGSSCLARYDHGTAESGDYENMSAAELATLPTDPQELGAYIDDHPSGDNRGTTNRFMAVGDLLRSGLATQELRSAALRLLAQTKGLTANTDARDAAGRPAVRIDYSFGYGIESLFFDADTSRVLEEQTTQGSYVYRAVVTKSEIVDSIDRSLPACPKPTVHQG